MLRCVCLLQKEKRLYGIGFLREYCGGININYKQVDTADHLWHERTICVVNSKPCNQRIIVTFYQDREKGVEEVVKLVDNLYGIMPLKGLLKNK